MFRPLRHPRIRPPPHGTRGLLQPRLPLLLLPRAARESSVRPELHLCSQSLHPIVQQSIDVVSSPLFMHLSLIRKNTSGDAVASPEVLPFLLETRFTSFSRSSSRPSLRVPSWLLS